MSENKSNTSATSTTTKTLNRNSFTIGRLLFGLCIIATVFVSFCDTKIAKYESNLAHLDKTLLNGKISKLGKTDQEMYKNIVFAVRGLFYVGGAFIILNRRYLGALPVLLAQLSLIIMDNAGICPAEFSQNAQYRNEQINSMASQLVILGASVIYLIDQGSPVKMD